MLSVSFSTLSFSTLSFSCAWYAFLPVCMLCSGQSLALARWLSLSSLCQEEDVNGDYGDYGSLYRIEYVSTFSYYNMLGGKTIQGQCVWWKT